MKHLIQTALFLGAVCIASAQGTFEAVQNYVPGQAAATVFGTGGWTFQPTVNVTVTDLGCTANAVADNGPTAVDIGLWNSAGVLLSSTPIQSTNVLINQTYYQSVTPVILTAGQTYHIGAYSPLGSILLNLIVQNVDGSVTMAPQIQLGFAASADGGFASPTTPQGPNNSMFLGPNFRFFQSIPEPSSLALLTIGSLALLLRRRSLAS